MRKLPSLFSLTLFILITGCQLTPTSSSQAEQAPYFANNALGNPLAMVQHPAGVHINDVTYVSYQGPLTDPYIAAYNHKTQQWQGPFKAGNSDLGKNFHKKPKIDSHGKPTMIIDDLGYIHIFYGGHGAGKKYGVNRYGGGGKGRNKHAVSKRPYDISEWQALENISIFGTYNQAIKMDNGDIYLFYRHGAHRSDWVYQKSTDHGRSFSEVVPFLKHKHRADIKATDSWYAWATKGKNNDIVIAYDYHKCWFRGEGPRGRGHVTERHDVYYMVFDTEKNTWRNINNHALAIPLTREMSDQDTLVARTGEGNWTFNGSVHLDEHGYPHISMNIGKDIGLNTGGPKQTSYYRYTGTAWQGGQPVSQQSRIDNINTRGDFVVHAADHVEFILGYQENDDGVIAKFANNNAEGTFSKGDELLRIPGANWALTALISNAHADAQQLVVAKRKGSQWHNIYLVGDNGPITRAAAKANVVTTEDKRYIK